MSCIIVNGAVYSSLEWNLTNVLINVCEAIPIKNGSAKLFILCGSRKETVWLPAREFQQRCNCKI